MIIKEKLYREEFLFSHIPFKPEEENIFLKFYFESLWRGGFQKSTAGDRTTAILSFVTDGEIIMTSPDGVAHRIGKNTFYAVTCHKDIYSYKVPENTYWQRRCLCFRRSALFDLLAGPFFQKDHMIIPLKNPEKISRIMDEFKVLLEQEPMAKSQISGLFLRLICELHLQEELQDIPEPLHKALDYIQLCFRDPDLSRTRIAAAAGVSIRTLNRLFREYKKTSIVQQILALRMEYAGKLLERSPLSVKEISGECGFHSANFFTRRFRDYFSVTPLEYRKKYFCRGNI